MLKNACFYFCSDSTIVLDAAYIPKETRLLQQAKEAGCILAYGLDMLIGQGLAAFELFTGREAPNFLGRIVWREYEQMLQCDPPTIRSRIPLAEVHAAENLIEKVHKLGNHLTSSI